MDTATISFLGLLLVSLTGNMVQLVINRGKPAMFNGALTSTIDARIAMHVVSCPNLRTLQDLLAEIREDMKEIRQDMKDHLQEHRENAEHNREQWHDPVGKR